METFKKSPSRDQTHDRTYFIKILSMRSAANKKVNFMSTVEHPRDESKSNGGQGGE